MKTIYVFPAILVHKQKLGIQNRSTSVYVCMHYLRGTENILRPIPECAYKSIFKIIMPANVS